MGTVSSELQACTPCTLLRPKTDISVKQILQWLFRGSIAPRKGAGKKVNPALGQKICKFDWKSEILPTSKQSKIVENIENSKKKLFRCHHNTEKFNLRHENVKKN